MFEIEVISDVRNSISFSKMNSILPAKRICVPIQMLIEAGDYNGAIATLNRLNRPDDANVLNMLGYAHRKLGLIEIGIRYYLAALENNPRHKGVHEYLGEAYLQMDDLAKAQVLLRKLGSFCGKGCQEYQELSLAIAEYRKAHSF